MAQDKKHRTLKELFRRPSSTSLAPQHSGGEASSTSGSHRSFLRSRNSRTSLHSSHSATSRAASPGSHAYFPSPAASPSASSHNSDSDSAHSASSVVHAKPKKPRRKLASHDSHHSLKRFFKKLQPHHVAKAPAPAAAVSSQLAQKYNVGMLIGAGASGSVSLITDKHDDSVVYALKKFRSKLKTEPEADYLRKVKNEFLVGEHLRQQNLIHTLEMIQETPAGASHPDFYIVMEYCPYDFFNLVMSGLMSRDEISCYFKQIACGVHYLHRSGIAHRDLKLDNCVVDAGGVLKLIDFGSAFQFRKSGSHPLLLAKGVVGSDPYLAPEVVSASAAGYDARLADVWSLAIIYCCMTLKRFPWKLPRASDPSYRSFAALTEHNEPVSASELLSGSVKDLSMSKDPLPKYGPERLLRTLPSASRRLIGAMLTIDFNQRVFIDDVVKDPFFESIEHCHYAEKKPDFADANTLVSTSPKTQSAENPLSVSVSSEPEFDSSAEEFHGWRDREFIKATNHKHHLITEKELQQITAERAKAKKAREEKENHAH